MSVHQITSIAGAGGRINPGGTTIPLAVEVNDGDSQTFTITPNTGFAISQVTVDAVNQGAIATYTFVAVTTDHTISATFSALGGTLPRADAMVNIIIDGVVDTLKQINGVSTRWLTHPRTVVRHSANPYKEAMPALVVTCTGYGANEPQTSGYHRVSAEIGVRCLTRYDTTIAEDDPHRALHRLAADVVSAIEQNWQLSALLSTGSIHVVNGYVASKELDAVSGFAECEVQLKAEWGWDYTAP